MKLQLLLNFVIALYSALSLAKFDSSAEIFFSPPLSNHFKNYQQTPITGWNFLIYDSDNMTKKEACQLLSPWKNERFLFNPCSPIPISNSWLKSLGLEKTLSLPPPQSEKDLKQKLDQALVQMSLPMESSALDMVRQFPVVNFRQSLDDLKNFFKIEKEDSSWKSLPFLFSKPASDKENLRIIMQENPKLLEKSPHFIWKGPHRGAYENKSMIFSDLKTVGILGASLILLLALFLFFSGRTIFFLVLPVTLVSIGISFLIVQFIWGSVHGLTLAFGSGLIGIAMDYAFHGWQEKHNREIWRSNAMSYLTTIVSFLTLSLFSMPLIKQISFFASLGLTLAFFLSYIISLQVADKYKTPFQLNLPNLPKKVAFSVASLFIGAALLSLPFIQTNLNLHSMDATQVDGSPEGKQPSPSAFKGKLAFQWVEKNNSLALSEFINWAQGNGWPVLNSRTLVAPASESKKNGKLWQELSCSPNSYLNNLKSKVPYDKLFAEFFEMTDCDFLKGHLSEQKTKEVFSSETHELALVLAPDLAAKEAIKKSYPNTFFLSQLTQDFPEILNRQIQKFFVLIVLATLTLLTFFFKNRAPMALLPTLGGMSGLILGHIILGLHLSFISFISGIMLMGLTLDYGIFGTSYISWKRPLNKVFGSITLSALTSLAGFGPLVFCQHPVLRDMGLTLSSGLLGALFICFLCYPSLATEHSPTKLIPLSLHNNKWEKRSGIFKKAFGLVALAFIALPFILIWLGNVTPTIPKESPLSFQQIKERSQFYPKEDWGVHQIRLTGSAFERGQQFGFWTKDLLLKQEKALVSKLSEVIPSKMAQYGLVFFSMGWFYGLDNYFEKEWLDEMYGVSLFGSKQNMFFSTPYTRQLAYHGIHDMGQMMIDQGLVLGACTQILTPLEQGWIVGRNFDFEAGPVFDEDKVIKWVFPDTGQAFVSVIFSGMVGVITGINQKGVYIAINAAGSEDFTRLGTPTTLVALKALQYSTSAKEAVEIIKDSKPLITDIFIVTDREETSYIVEKTPKQIRVLEKKKKFAVTNHLQHPDWENDSVNTKRKNSNTTLARLKRANNLLKDSAATPARFVEILRDKVEINGQVAPGHRGSIDALIASHSVIYDSNRFELFVSQGPSLSQEFIGIDLEKSFATQEPVLTSPLPADPFYEDLDFQLLKKELTSLFQSIKDSKDKNCFKAENKIKSVNLKIFKSHYAYYWAKGEWLNCIGKIPEAIDTLKQALKLNPPYQHERDQISEKLRSIY